MEEITTLEELENAPAESTATEPTAEGREISRLTQDNGLLRSQLDNLRSQLSDAHQRHVSDIAKIGETLISEANEREWCTEYDEIIDRLNRRLNVSLPLREREYTVEVPLYLTIRVTARDDESAEELAYDIVSDIERYADNRDGCVSRIGEYSTEEV